MGYGDGRRFGKFYWRQVEYIIHLLRRQHEEKIDYEQYIRICEQLGEEPDPNKMPVDISVFPTEVQQAFLVHETLPDRWDGMSGSYLGKDWSALESILNIYEIEDKRTVVYFLKHVESQHSMSINKELKRKRDAEARKRK